MAVQGFESLGLVPAVVVVIGSVDARLLHVWRIMKFFGSFQDKDMLVRFPISKITAHRVLFVPLFMKTSLSRQLHSLWGGT